MREQLEQRIAEYHLTERAWEWFWKNYDSYLEEEPEESAEHGLFSRDSVLPVLCDKSYHIKNHVEIIRITIQMHLKKDGTYAGEYDSDFDMDGNEFDDWFTVE